MREIRGEKGGDSIYELKLVLVHVIGRARKKFDRIWGALRSPQDKTAIRSLKITDFHPLPLLANAFARHPSLFLSGLLLPSPFQMSVFVCTFLEEEALVLVASEVVDVAHLVCHHVEVVLGNLEKKRKGISFSHVYAGNVFFFSHLGAELDFVVLLVVECPRGRVARHLAAVLRTLEKAVRPEGLRRERRGGGGPKKFQSLVSKKYI